MVTSVARTVNGQFGYEEALELLKNILILNGLTEIKYHPGEQDLKVGSQLDMKKKP